MFLIVQPTENIDVSCELAAAVDVSWMMHLLRLSPYVSVDVISMTHGYRSSTNFSNSNKYEIVIHSTHASVHKFIAVMRDEVLVQLNALNWSLVSNLHSDKL